MNQPRRFALVVLLFFTVAASAQDAHGAAAGGKQSLFTMIIKGLEWPAYFIFFGSIVVISLIVEHFINVRRATIIPPDQVQKSRQLIETREFRQCLDSLQKSSTFFARTMTAALQHARHGFDAMHAAAVEKAGELSGRMFRKVEYMNIIGNLGPLMGLLGTVLGMIVAFQGMSGGGGEANAGELARGISLALVNTLLGLSLAVVGLGMFGICRNRIDSLTVEATVQALDLLEYFRGSAVRQSSSASPEAAAARRTAATKAPAEA